MSLYSDAAIERQRLVAEKTRNGEPVLWRDLCGIYQPNPDLPDCQAHDDGWDHKCDRENGHPGLHRHVIEWGQP